MSPADIAASLKGRTTLFRDEVRLHEQMGKAFIRSGFAFRREVRVACGRLDFLFDDGTALEVKVSGGGNAVIRQVVKYLNLPEINDIIIVSTKALALPFNEWLTPEGVVKPIHLVEIWKNAF